MELRILIVTEAGLDLPVPLLLITKIVIIAETI